jgi:RNA polymerase sigma-70 factor (ECF subfamily)
MATKKEIDDFLKVAQKRAFKTAFFAVRNEEAALDIVQDAMIKLCEKYSAKPAADLAPLFGRIVQNRIHDHFRKDKTLSKINLLYEDFGPADSDGYDFLEALRGDDDAGEQDSPDGLLSRSQTMAAIEQALADLPERQRQAFILRHWDGLDTEEAAAAMGVSTGSVKTHLSRATHALAEALGARGIKL